MQFLTVDYIFMGVIALSAIIGLWRGFVKETLSLINMALAIGLSWSFYAVAAELLQNYTKMGDVPAKALGFVSIFIICLLIGSLVLSLVNKVIKKTGLGLFNRLFGMFFGLLRGTLIIVVCSILLNAGCKFIMKKQLSDFDWWKNAELTEYVETINTLVKERINYDELPKLPASKNKTEDTGMEQETSEDSTATSEKVANSAADDIKAQVIQEVLGNVMNER